MNTVKVRIAVAVDVNGRWCSHGEYGLNDSAAMRYAVDDVDSHHRRYWIEHELELPEEIAVQGEVTEATQRDDPQPGDVVVKVEETRTVTQRVPAPTLGGEYVQYTRNGESFTASIVAWRDWCRGAVLLGKDNRFKKAEQCETP